MPRSGLRAPATWRTGLLHRSDKVVRSSGETSIQAKAFRGSAKDNNSPQFRTETIRKRNSKSVSFGASGRKKMPSLRLSICMMERGDDGGKNRDVNDDDNSDTDEDREQNRHRGPPTFGLVHLR